MKKGLFLIADEGFLLKESGIGNKIRKEVEIFNNNELVCEIVLQKNGKEHLPTIIGKILYYLPYTNKSPHWEVMKEFSDVDFVYFRHPAAITYKMKRIIEKAKRMYPNLKFFMEIPTFPYDGEYIGLKNKICLFKDRVNRRKLKGVIDCIFAIDPTETAKKVFDVETVSFMNGYDVINSKTRKFVDHEGIVLTCVGMFNKWHGYERLIEGLHNYYLRGGNKRIYIEMVGEGSELTYYKELVKKYELQNYVHFRGKLFDEELEKIYSITDIGVSSLGRYKSNIYVLGDLKSREYFAKGIPVLSGCRVDFFENTKASTPYYLEVENDASFIDMDKIIEFYDYIQKKKMEISVEDELYSFSLNTFDINQTLKPVIDMIKKS